MFSESKFDIQYREKMENFYRDIIGNVNEINEFIKGVLSMMKQIKSQGELLVIFNN